MKAVIAVSLRGKREEQSYRSFDMKPREKGPCLMSAHYEMGALLLQFGIGISD